jgi:hypothetical protein
MPEIVVLFASNHSEGNGNAYIPMRRPADSSTKKMKIGLKTSVKQSILDKVPSPPANSQNHFPS